jgi:hypothetical protein
MLIELAVAAVGVAIGVAVLKRPRPVVAEPDPPRVQKLVELRAQVARAIQQRDLSHLMADQLAQVDAVVDGFRKLHREERRLAARAEGPKRELLAENLGILRQRQAKQVQIHQTHDTLKAHLDMQEDAVKLVLDQALTASTPAELEVDLQRLTRTIAATDEALAETRTLLPEMTRNA